MRCENMIRAIIPWLVLPLIGGCEQPHTGAAASNVSAVEAQPLAIAIVKATIAARSNVLLAVTCLPPPCFAGSYWPYVENTNRVRHFRCAPNDDGSFHFCTAITDSRSKSSSGLDS